LISSNLKFGDIFYKNLKMNTQQKKSTNRINILYISTGAQNIFDTYKHLLKIQKLNLLLEIF